MHRLTFDPGQRRVLLLVVYKIEVIHRKVKMSITLDFFALKFLLKLRCVYTGRFCCSFVAKIAAKDAPGNTKGGSVTVQLTSCLTGLD
jgi:hypothetical protein